MTNDRDGTKKSDAKKKKKKKKKKLFRASATCR
jgi:hypothetical protein